MIKTLKKFSIFIYTAVGILPFWGAEGMDHENKENSSSAALVLSQKGDVLMQIITDIAHQIKGARENASAGRIGDAYKVFDKLAFDEETWEAIGQSRSVFKWPSQATWKEAVGGDLFFPSQIMEWDATYTEAYRLERIDTIWSLAIGAKFRHPFSMYYLAQVLDTIFSNSTDAPKPDFFSNLYGKAFETLEKSQETPDICYILGLSYSRWIGILVGRDDDEKAIEYHTKGGDLKNQYRILKVKGARRKVHPSPEEYLDLARAGYPLAYLEFARPLEDRSQKLEVLGEAVEKGYITALLNIADVYGDLHDKCSAIDPKEDCLQKAREYYQKAGEKGISEAYIRLGKTYVGDIALDYDDYQFKEKFYALPPGAIETAASCFQQAGEAHHPKGWDCLFHLHLLLYQQAEMNAEKVGIPEWEQKKEQYADLLYETLEKGIRIGSQSAYHNAYSFFHEDFKELCEQYGYAPQDQAFRLSIERFVGLTPPDPSHT